MDSLEPLMLAAEDHVFVLWCHEAHDARSGRGVALPAVSVYRLRDGLISDSTMFHLDTAALMKFLHDAGDAG